tara:strand:- start:4065 stop:7436 length:3372 start_codon:yes stop_codon:yes gene_type:complete
MNSKFASWMDHFILLNPNQAPIPDEDDPLMSALQNKGNKYELEILNKFKQEDLNIIDLKEQPKNTSKTKEVLLTGADIIYQATLESDEFKGIADFLIKTPVKSALGDFHYEVWDVKLASTVKPYFVIQLCCYVEILESLQGIRPEYMGIFLGNGDKIKLRVTDYFYYYLNLKKSFLAMHLNFDSNNQPDLNISNNFGRWSNYAENILKSKDHLFQIANITKGQIKKLNNAEVFTMQALIDTDKNYIKGIKDSVLARLKEQAAIQKTSENKNIPEYKVLTHELDKKHGLALLPEASSHDIFFDIEGYPLESGGLEYLWGVTYFDEQGVRQYKDFWAHNKEQEKTAFQDFITWTYKRWQENNKMHIYHYANYEIAACRKLMGRYGVCEIEVDQLLRNEVFVDLYKIIKGGLLIGEPKYSIKNVEHLYRDKRTTDVGKGSDSVVVYENWRENPDGDNWQTSRLLNDLREYNIDDCNSTQELADWLRLRQQENNINYLGKTEKVEPESKEEIIDLIKLRDDLLLKAKKQNEQNNEDFVRVSLLFAWSLEFHTRENKPVFWKMFDRLGLSNDELYDDIECLAECIRTKTVAFKPTPKARILAYEYSFDVNQEFKGASSNYYILGKIDDKGNPLKVKYIKDNSDINKGLIVLQMKEELIEPLYLIPDEYINPAPIPEAIKRQAEAFNQGSLNGTAILDFINRNEPRIIGRDIGKPIAPSHNSKERLAQIIKAVLNLNNSYLTIQGPPGSGKTYTGKHIIAELIKQGKKIGISSNSHKAINNLLISTVEYCNTHNITGYFACTKNTDDKIDQLKINVLSNNKIFENIKSGCVIGTTAWGFSREDLADNFDYLLIDEAGQVSVANLIAMSQSTKNIILMGDQMQLGQPLQGSHPEDSGLSILDYLLHTTPAIPENMGIFLGTTYRMHPEVNKFISDFIYESKLESAVENEKQFIKIPEGYEGVLNKKHGIIRMPVFHEGNTQFSDEEVDEIALLANQMLGRTLVNKDGSEKLIDWGDMLFVTPYNYQVNRLKAKLGNEAKVGSVDKFQGQEAPIVFLSMCASDANDSPRGMNFLFDKNRINVAISRAKVMAVIVYSPSLLDVNVSNIEQMNMVNLFCGLMVQWEYRENCKF